MAIFWGEPYPESVHPQLRIEEATADLRMAVQGATTIQTLLRLHVAINDLVLDLMAVESAALAKADRLCGE